VPFEKEQYVEVEKIGCFPSGNKTVNVGLWAYADGSPRVRIYTTGEKKDGSTFESTAGSFTADEARQLGPLLVQAGEALAAQKPKPKGKKS
jgi:hypothetical protein